MFESLFARLSDHFHLVAPDYPGFGHSDWPDPKKFAYTFDHIAEMVATFVASGNVVFETTTKKTKTLERKIERALKGALGYEVRTFVRGEAELAEIANYRLFPHSKFDETWLSNIIFLADSLNEKLKQSVDALRTDTDAFEVHGQEIYWRCRRKQNKALFSTVPLEKILGPAFTVRGADTIKRIVSKYCSSKIC
jgi:uncharacterized protein (DUF1697 family)